MPVPDQTAPLLSVDVSIALSTTTDLVVSNPNDIVIQSVQGFTDAILYFFVQGADAGNTGDAIFTLQRSPDGLVWFDLPTRTIPQDAANVVTDEMASAEVDLRGVDSLRLSTVQNADSNDAVLINVGIRPFTKP